MRRHDLTKKRDNDKDKDKDNYKDNDIYVYRQSQRLVTFETLIAILTIENLNS